MTISQKNRRAEVMVKLLELMIFRDGTFQRDEKEQTVVMRVKSKCSNNKSQQ